MIGWTELGVIKVWMNEDFSQNRKEGEVVNEEAMVGSLI